MTPEALLAAGAAASAGGVLLLLLALRSAARFSAPRPLESDWDQRLYAAPCAAPAQKQPAKGGLKRPARSRTLARRPQVFRQLGQRTPRGARLR